MPFCHRIHYVLPIQRSKKCLMFHIFTWPLRAKISAYCRAGLSNLEKNKNH